MRDAGADAGLGQRLGPGIFYPMLIRREGNR